MTLADKYLDAKYEYIRLEEELEEALYKICNYPDDWYMHSEYPHWEGVHVDPCDWDGQSIELKHAKDGFEFTEEQKLLIWELGFNVIDIEYTDLVENKIIAGAGGTVMRPRYKRWLKDVNQCHH